MAPMANGSAADKRAAALRRDLLRTRTAEQAASAAQAVVREIAGPSTVAVTILASPPRRDSTPAPPLGDITRSSGDPEASSWMARVAVDSAFALELRSAAGSVYGRLMIAAGKAAIEEVRDELAGVAADLAEALEIVASSQAAREASRLREELRRRDDLVRQAGEALIRDAHEVVRVVAELEQRDERINEALQAALRFQRAMLAPLPEQPDVALSTVYLPAEMISGDFYDVAVMGPDWLRIFIADATGHGVAAGLATMFIKSEYEAQKRSSDSPAAVLRSINERISAAYQNLELQFTALCIDVYARERRLRYASAAHPGAKLHRGDTVIALPSGGPFMGVTTGVDFPELERTLEADDVIVAFTDGLTDAEAADGSPFGDAGIARALAGARGDAAGGCASLIRALASFVGEGHGLADDVTVVAIAIAPTKTASRPSERPEDAL
jgi:sigma-B regulation protein RsbU (phosphoserine phosphatase)